MRFRVIEWFIGVEKPVGDGETSAVEEIGLGVKVYRSQSWFMRLASIICVLYSKTY